MSAVGVVRPASATCSTNTGAVQSRGTIAAPLLPAPIEVSGDAMMALMTLMSKNRELGKQEAQSRVCENSRNRKEAIAREFQAYQEASRARESGGFWGKVKSACSTLGKLAAVAGSVAAVVATAGTGTPFALAVVGAALSAGAFAQGETKLLQQLGVSDSAAGWMELGMSVGGAACIAGASIAAGAGVSGAGDAAAKAGDSGTKAGSAAAKAGKAASDSAKGLGEAANKMAGASGNLAGLLGITGDGVGVPEVINATVKAAAVVQGIATVASGVATIKESNHEADAADKMAEGLSVRLARERLERMLRQLLDDLQQDDKSAERSMASLRGAIETRGNTLTAASIVRA